ETTKGDWKPVQLVFFDTQVMRAQYAAKVRVMDRIPAKRIFKTPAGDTVIDFAQNMAGRIEVTAAGKPGDVIELHCFEVLDKDGNVYLDNL
ncbi:family 78 glycoside hydrolase catalytic domain, partial [Escherichia coli]